MIDKDLRKKLSLPITKDIVYVSDTGDRIPVESIEIISTGAVTGLSSLDCQLSNSEHVRVCSEYLVEMQKQNFER